MSDEIIYTNTIYGKDKRRIEVKTLGDGINVLKNTLKAKG